MYSKNYKGRCDKKRISKCKDVIRCYDAIMIAYVDVLEKDEDVVEVRCNVPLEDFCIGDYTTDFVCILRNGDIRVRECVIRNKLVHHITVKWMDASRNYWLRRGVHDWGIVINAEE